MNLSRMRIGAASVGVVLLLAMTLGLDAGCGRHDRTICVDYFDQYAACIAKMGPEARVAAEQNLRRERERLQALARDSSTRAQAATACQASLNAIKSTCP